MLQDLFHKQKQYLDYFFTHIREEECELLLKKILSSRGVIFFTGVGKSGFIAQKIAATMLSTGTKAFFIHPIDALHGDLGMVFQEDIVIFLSKSGETEELLQLLPALRNKKACICAVTSQLNSRLVRGADISIYLPCIAELCPFDLAPTTSTQLQLLFGDALTIALMEAKGFSVNDYAGNHPAGRIGRRATLKVQDLMLDKERTPLCFPGQKLQDVLVDFSDKRCGCLIVIDENKQLQGIFTDGDLRRALQKKGKKILQEKIGNLMTKTPKTISTEALAWDALKLMESDQKFPVMVLPVLNPEKKEVVGIIKMHDLIQAGL